jgi:hypothetical protein
MTESNSPAEHLAQLLERRRELTATIADAESSATIASRERLEAEDAVRQAERARLGGSGTDAAVRAAEKALAKAKDEAAQPWGLRASAAREALRDVDKRISAHIAENFEAFAGDYNVQAQLAAERVNEALRAAVEAIREREVVAQRAAELWRWVATPVQNLTPYSRCEQLARDLDAFLMAGGERAPVMPLDFRPENAAPEEPPREDPEPAVAGATARPRRRTAIRRCTRRRPACPRPAAASWRTTRCCSPDRSARAHRPSSTGRRRVPRGPAPAGPAGARTSRRDGWRRTAAPRPDHTTPHRSWPRRRLPVRLASTSRLAAVDGMGSAT